MFFSKVKNSFHKLKVGVERMVAEPLPEVSAEKEFGNFGESSTLLEIKKSLPDALILQSICLNPDDAKGEIDYLLVYQDKVFIIELKTWEGCVYQEGDNFYKDKVSKSGEVYQKEMKSPFRQIRGNICQIKQSFPKIWFEPIVLFQNCDSLSITEEKIKWYDDVKTMTYDIRISGKPNRHEDVQKMLKKLILYDVIKAEQLDEKEDTGIIDETAFIFSDGVKKYGKADIAEIIVTHHFSYDNLNIKLLNGTIVQTRNENSLIQYKQNGQTKSVALNKVDYIKIGRFF